MRVVYISNYMNHHQLPLCLELYRELGDDFMFLALEKVPAERIAFGYRDMDGEYPFVTSISDPLKIVQFCDDCEMLLVGSAPARFYKNRLSQGKPVIKCSERFFRKGRSWKQILRNLLCALRHIRRYQHKPLYFLCASAYTAGDVNAFADYRGRVFRWGYFPDTHGQPCGPKIANSILWAARFLPLKHPEAMVELGKKLNKDGVRFTATMLGCGELLEFTQRQIKAIGLEDNIHTPGAVPVDQVRGRMGAAQIFLLTSDQNEGWGAVVNEAMAAGCAVVASDGAGATLYLLNHGENGMVFPSGDWEAMHQCVQKLLENPALAFRIGQKAIETVTGLWSAEVAAQRLLCLIQCILDGDDPNSLYIDGPCSPAEIL